MPFSSTCFVLICYCTGRKKLKQVEAEISRLSTISHPNLLRVLAVKLSLPHGNGAGPARLVILSEERPSLSLEDVLEDSECLRENKATVRFMVFVWNVYDSPNTVIANRIILLSACRLCTQFMQGI